MAPLDSSRPLPKVEIQSSSLSRSASFLGTFSLPALSFLTFDAQPTAEFEDDGRNDLEGLVEFLTNLRQKNVRLREVTYVINKFALGGIIPMTHHGFILKTSTDDYLTLDFSRKGIVWEVMEVWPELPDNTFYTKSYRVDMDTSDVQKYCEETPPFNFPFYDCETWAKGLIAKLSLDKIAQDEDCWMDFNASKEIFPVRPAPAPRKQRTGACL